MEILNNLIPIPFNFCLRGTNMQRVDISNFYRLGQVIHPLTEFDAGKPLRDYLFNFYMADSWITYFIQDMMLPMTICKTAAWKIKNGIQKFIKSTPEEEKIDAEKVLDYKDLYEIKEGAKEFEIVFSAEIQNMAVYFVSKKGIYDTNDLISNADNLFTETVKKYISEQSIIDIREAGKCLAFDLATAAGFHIARAVERVLVDYLNKLCPDKVKELKEGQRNFGGYIKLCRENTIGDNGEKLCSSLDQFRDLHRNPLMHPEAVLSVDDAITLLGIAQSAIVSIALEMASLNGNIQKI